MNAGRAPVPSEAEPAESMLLLSRAHFPVTVLGPGTRAGIWTQGCTIGCAGCLSRDTWEADPSTAVPVARLLDWLSSLPPVDGVTISGGEPFQQPDGLGALLSGIHAWRGERPIDILVYSGYAFSRLRRDARSRRLLEMCDAVIAGPYVARRAPAARGAEWPPASWFGSANQRLVPLTPLGREKYGDLETKSRDDASDGATSPHIQVCVTENRVYYIGIPRPGDMDRLTERLARAGIDPGEVSWRP